jgi:predicted N-formylglutamate amidohydrolase
MIAPAVRSDAVSRVGRPGPGGILLTCEHASNRVPAPWRPRPADRRLLATHWGFDIGAAAVTRELARRLPAVAVMSRFSRLLLDPNRAPDDPTLVLTHTDDGAPSFNRSVDRAARIMRFHDPFHAEVDAAVRRHRPRLLVSIHTFTPSFRDQRRPMEAGVLFDRHDELAGRLVAALAKGGLATRANEPYSGKDGLIYSAARHGAAHDVPYLEIELRQDLVASRRGARDVAARVRRALGAL